jgi:ATP-binding cassette subfamily C protein CydCD
MPAVDRRLLAQVSPARAFVAVAVALGLLTAAMVVVQAWLIAEVVSAAVQRGRGLRDVAEPVVVLFGVILTRAALVWLIEVTAHRSSAAVKSELRRAFLQQAIDLGPSWLVSRRVAELETLGTRGLDALDPYFARYLPQLFLAAIVPTAVLVAVATQDRIAAAVMLVTLPLIPLFMWLVGITTQARAARRLTALQRLGGQFLDSIAGLTTLKIFGGAASQARQVGFATDALRRETLGTLRVAFLSSLVLELLASLSVAVVAVAVGLRLVSGDLDFFTGLFVLVLAPEAYQPLRLLAAQFHASADGVAAAGQVFEVLDVPLPHRGSTIAVPDPSTHRLQIHQGTVRYPGDPEPVFTGLNLCADPGEIVALVGPSGSGKSTALGVVLGYVALESGWVTIGEQDLSELDLAAWRTRVAWVPQRPYLFAGSLGDNIGLGWPDAPPRQIEMAVASAGLTDLVRDLPAGLGTVLGERGHGLSAGERQRVALARAFVMDADVLVLDEPTASLDGDTEASILSAVRRLSTGRTVLMAAHRPALVAMADRTVRLDGAR